MAVKFGTFVAQGWMQELTGIDDAVEQYETMSASAQEAERSGFDSVWVYDHFHTVPQPTQKATFEAWTAMAGLARDTRTVSLGQMCTCNSYRPPSLLAKMSSCIDAMSNGRLIMGIGAGWYEHEYNAYGYEFGTMPDRLRMLRESVRVLKAMWTEDEARYEGRFYQVRGAINQPKPVQQPHIPLWIAGGGEQVTLKLVAKEGDACNIGGDLETARRKLAILRQHCEAAGRDYDSIVKSTNMHVYLGDEPEVERLIKHVADRTGTSVEAVAGSVTARGSGQAIADRIKAYQELGFDYFILVVPDRQVPGAIARVAEEIVSKVS